MSLRLKFVLLISGSIIIPIMVFTVTFRSDDSFGVWRNSKSLYSPRAAWRTEIREGISDADYLSSVINSIPMLADVRVYNKSGTKVLERVSEKTGVAADDILILETIPFELSSGEVGQVKVTFPYPRFIADNTRFLVPLTGLIFIAVMAILIGQSINRSISLLERASSRIAEGDLDFKLPQKRGNDKFASLIRSFDSMRAHLKEEYARRSRFIMGISHDLKTPLSSIGGYVDAIRDGYADTPEKLEKYISIIEGKTDLLESRISMLIDFFRRDTDEWKMSLSPIDIGSFLTEYKKIFETETLVVGRRFSGNVNIPSRIDILMDGDMMVRAFENLAKNALQYSPEGSEIVFNAILENGTVLIEFANEGPGISKADIKSIFEPFVRGARDRKGGGFGLGLATVESILSSHGFSISADSMPGSQTVFCVSIPIVVGE
ncbi:MAG: hypothetical protein CMN78_06435 [Spirochaetales bacterium]|nr:hypothetical protein [Spirochaetales bacterium]